MQNSAAWQGRHGVVFRERERFTSEPVANRLASYRAYGDSLDSGIFPSAKALG